MINPETAGILFNLIGGAIGGNIAGALFLRIDQGIIGNSIAGIIGGGIGGSILYWILGVNLGGSELDPATVLGTIIAGAVGGCCLLVGTSIVRHYIGR